MNEIKSDTIVSLDVSENELLDDAERDMDQFARRLLEDE